VDEFEDETWSGNFFTRRAQEREAVMVMVVSPHGRFEGRVEDRADGVMVTIISAKPMDRRGITPEASAGIPRMRSVIHEELLDACFHVALDYAHDLVHAWERG
jgi:hypothetical protein